MIYIIGLGNPGEEYENTRHNFGFCVLDLLAKKYDGMFKEKTYGKTTVHESKIKIARSSVILIKPQTFMNNSGMVISALKLLKKDAEKVMVIHDELAIAEGTLKVSFNKSAGGHKGVESIIKAIKTEGIARIRIGAAPATPSGKLKPLRGEKEVLDRILKQMPPAQFKKMQPIFKNAVTAAEIFAEEGIGKAMTIGNNL